VKEESPSSTGGGGGVSGGFFGGSPTPSTPTRVVVTGKAYPNSDVHILKDGEVVGVVKADGKADFYFATSDVTPGVATFGFWAADDGGLKSIAFTTTFRISSGTTSNVSGVFLPPTIDVNKRKVSAGELLHVSGTTIPEAKVFTHVNSEDVLVQEGFSDDRGKWEMDVDTARLKEEEFHTAKSFFEVTNEGGFIRSGFSQALTFYVGDQRSGGAEGGDINGDNKVNLIDFSILLFHWGTANPLADINADGKVNLTDFSIMIFHWTG